MENSILSELNWVTSYAYWSCFFTDKKYQKWQEFLAKEGYVWPSPAEAWKEMRHGRKCPLCKEENDHVIAIEPVTLLGVTIRIIYCLCKLLPYMDEDFEFMGEPMNSYWEPVDLKQFKTWGDKAIDTQTEQVLLQVGEFTRMPLGWYYLYGGVGAGKTMAMYMIKTHFRGLALYMNMYDFNQLVFTAMESHKLGKLVDTVSSAPILLLDDLGTEYPSPFFLSSLYGVINRRYAMKWSAPTFFTSNLAFSAMLNSPSTDMKRIGDRVSDKNLTTTIVTKQPSWRQRG